jgi:hypothetical protein
LLPSAAATQTALFPATVRENARREPSGERIPPPTTTPRLSSTTTMGSGPGGARESVQAENLRTIPASVAWRIMQYSS